jgi:hypothetical protein
MVLLLGAAGCTGDSSSSDGPTTSSTADPGSFYGDWFRHATAVHLSRDGTGTYVTHVGFTPDGSSIDEILQLDTAASADGRTLEVQVTAVAFAAYDEAGNPTPVGDPDPAHGPAVGDRFAYRFAAPHLLRGSERKVEDPGGFDQFLCSNETRPSDQEHCGA